MGARARITMGRGGGDEKLIIGAALCCCFIVGLCIFFPILFTITLEDADDIDSIVETMCNYQSVQDHPYWLCQRQDVQCQEGQGCDGYSNANGDCGAWLTARAADGSATTDREISPCCSGQCCARTVRRCQTCYSDSRRRTSSFRRTDWDKPRHKTSDGKKYPAGKKPKGARKKSQDELSSAPAVSSVSSRMLATFLDSMEERRRDRRDGYYDCNCYDECVAYSTQQENVACDTGHRYEIELDFILDGVSYNVTHHDKCDLTSAGYEDTECMAKLQTKYTAADEPCYVDKRMLPECGAAGTTNTCVSYSGPEWNIGAWVGIVIGGLMMLVGMIGGCIACGGHTASEISLATSESALYFVVGWLVQCALYSRRKQTYQSSSTMMNLQQHSASTKRSALHSRNKSTMRRNHNQQMD